MNTQPLKLSCVILLWSFCAFAQDNVVVPGKQVGPVHLGDTRAAVISALGKPSETKRWRSGLVKDSWSAAKRAAGGEESQTSFTVIYRADRVVQIEFDDPKYQTAEGLSIASSLAQFRAAHKRPRVSAFVYDDGDGSGYVGYYYDDVAGGITFSFGTQDYFDATIIPGALRVHAAGQFVILDPGGKPTKANDERPVEKPKNQHQDLLTPKGHATITPLSESDGWCYQRSL